MTMKLLKGHSPRSRRDLTSRLSAYSLAVGATLAAGTSADAAVVYNDIADLTTQMNLFLDFDGNGTTDLGIKCGPQSGVAASDCWINTGDVIFNGSYNGIEAFAAVLGASAAIGAGGPWQPSALMPVMVYSNNGNWPNQSNKYLGVRFKIGTNTHYAWVRMSLSGSPGYRMDVFDYAYQSTANTQILAGEKGPPPNTAPSLAHNAGLTLNQTAGQTTITTALLQATDPEQGAASLTYSVGTAPSKGTLKKSGTTLSGGNSFTQADIDANLISYTPTGSQSGADSFTFTVSDGAGGSIGSTTFSISITDNVSPTVSSVSVPGGATYVAGQNLDFTVNFSENVTVVGTDSTLGLTVGATSRTAAYLSKTATSITYRYTVQSGDQDSDGISVGSLTLNTTTIRDAASNNANLTLNSVGSTASVLVSTIAPTATTGVADSITTTGAVLNGTVNDNGATTTVSFDYGTTTGYGTNVTATTGGTISAWSGTTATAVTLSGLTCNTTYHFRVKGTSSGGATNGLDASFTTSACLSQTIGAITFTPETLIVSGTTTASATASSGLSVSFSSLTPSVCTVSGSTVTGVAAGVCSIAADQAGDASYNAASRVTRSFTVANAANKVHLTHDSTTTDYTTIQAAADASVDGDTISVDAGTFVEQVTITTAVTLQGAGSDQTIIQAPDNSSLVAISPTTINGRNRMAILALQTATPGTGTITVRNLGIDGHYQGETQAQFMAEIPANTSYSNWLIGIASFDSNAVVDSVDIQHVAAPLDGSGNYEGLGTGFGIVAEGSSALASAVTVTVQNATIGTFQKAGIVAWGPKMNATIANNQISGVGILGRSGQNGMQIGSAGTRAGTTATISGNTIDHLGAPDDLVGYGATGILPVTSGAMEAYNNTIALDPGASASKLVGIDVGYTSDVATLHDNTLNGMSVGIQVSSPKQTAVHQISSNTLSTVGGNPVIFLYDPAGNDDTGGETIDNFGTGYAIQVKGENFSSGTLTAGDGTGLAANSVQAAITGSAATLYIDSSVAKSGAMPLPVTLNGTYVLGNFVLSGEYIRFAKVGQTISFANPGAQEFGTSPTLTATATSGLTVSFTSSTTGVCTITGGGALTFVTTGSCTINADQSGNSAYSAASTVTRTFDVTLAPSITSDAATSFDYGSVSSFTITTGGYPTPTLTHSGELPLGVSFHDNGNGTATVSGTPNASGTFTITITATNSAGHVDQTFTLTVDPAVTDTSAVDGNIAVTPERHLFGSETVGACASSTAVPFTVTNIGTTPLLLETPMLGGTNAGEYQISTHDCPVNPVTFAAGASCTASVKFCPTGTTGSKTALLQIGSNSLRTPVISAFLHNYESSREEAIRRMPPVLERLSIPEVLSGNSDYTITWSLLGYEEDYLSRIVIFACADLTDGTCGETYNDARRYHDSGSLSPIASATGDWTYNGVTSTRYDYSHTFKTPAGPTNIVIRFYRKSQSDNAAGKGSLSLLIPGGALQTGTDYYDKEGRRIKHPIVP